MCGCLVLLLGALFPRFALVLIEMFTDWNDQAFDSFWIGFAGWLFLPFTLHRRPRELVRCGCPQPPVAAWSGDLDE